MGVVSSRRAMPLQCIGHTVRRALHDVIEADASDGNGDIIVRLIYRLESIDADAFALCVGVCVLFFGSAFTSKNQFRTAPSSEEQLIERVHCVCLFCLC